MPDDPYSSLRESVKQAAKAVFEVSTESLVQTKKHGLEGGFAELEPLFESNRKLFKTLAEADLSLASLAKLTALLQVARDIFSEISQIKAYQPRANPQQERAGRMEAFRQQYDKAYDAISTVIALSRIDVIEEQSKLSAIVNDLQVLKEKTTQEVKDFLASVRESAGKIGVSEHAQIFQIEAHSNNVLSRVWLAVTGALAALTGWFAWLNYTKAFDAIQTALKMPPPSQGVSFPLSLTIQLALAKLIGFSILFSAVLWAGRIYRAHRHNYVVNKHRQNALSTFQIFDTAAKGDDTTRNAVLLQATQCIFSPQSTGYMTSEKELEGPSQLVEIIRSIPTGKP